ncbi:MAG: hypothetical protein LBN27_01940 [Prevotellaceae bacterium]|jgi:hypothetical protein|nr:hypothetical protein [Prevotellaceae bacterium]
MKKRIANQNKKKQPLVDFVKNQQKSEINKGEQSKVERLKMVIQKIDEYFDKNWEDGDRYYTRYYESEQTNGMYIIGIEYMNGWDVDYDYEDTFLISKTKYSDFLQKIINLNGFKAAA